MEFEQALQAVDPAIAAPYWDYSIDTEKYGHVGNIASESAIFTKEWFGPLDNAATNNVLAGRYFTDIPVPQDKHAPEHNGYGFVTDSVNSAICFSASLAFFVSSSLCSRSNFNLYT